MSNFQVQRKDNGKVSVLHISGYLDAHTAPEFENAFRKLIEEKRYYIVVCMEGLQYISSAGLGVFMGFIEEVRSGKGDIKLCEVSPRVFKVFDLLGFPSLYEFYEKQEQAIDQFQK